MLVREAKLKGTQASYQALDEAIRTAQFVRNKCVGISENRCSQLAHHIRGVSPEELETLAEALLDLQALTRPHPYG